MRNTTVLIRHANRQDISHPDKVRTAELTLDGVINAHKAGRFLKQKFPAEEIYTSPFKRCIDTGKVIALAYGNGMRVIGEESEYGALCCGFLKEGKAEEWFEISCSINLKEFFEDITKAYSTYHSFGIMKYNNAFDYARDVLAKYLMKKDIIAVTHDSTIAPVLAFLSAEYKCDIELAGKQPPYLTGVAIRHEEGNIISIKSVDALKNVVKICFPCPHE